jgi:succinate dehydrogenase / fumarate reductase cytochrome b subunit
MRSLWQTACRFYASSIGKKVLVAVTALVLAGFLVGHLAGNLLMFSGPEAVNAYALKLREMGPLLWVVRFGLLAAVAVHIVVTVHLAAQNRAARPEAYAVEATVRATRSSRIMLWSGLTIACFVIYHLMHFTWGTFNRYHDPDGPYALAGGGSNVYKMVVDGFRVWANSGFYLLALGLLCSHLSHGMSSVFQTLGLTTPRTRPLFTVFGWAFALVIFCGFASIPIAVLAGALK